MRGRKATWKTTTGWLLTVGAIAAGGIAVSAGTASAGDGCVPYKGGCGKVVNHTTPITTCISWHGNGDDGTYQTSGYCKKKGKVYTNGTSTATHDVDAIYIPKGMKFVGSGRSHNRLFPSSWCGGKRSWTHRGNGWWKFGNYCTITLDYWTTP
ncbi:hypothetical protein GCM10009527_074000 [Actinomadura nitritigenes]|uniref:Secreted protein n=1 Tax=Actinomadura nitritigenes TaxID=134602 RepID=A0ABS3R271_9ACTN|nr:hypothetical protein [Actinomadura nitritigenes]MBO2440340.1 hypothetical protein [Actinomadura nitritigenes]